MSEGEKRANEAIAQWLRADWVKGPRPRTLDIGAAFPWLAHSLANLGCDATAFDGEPHPFEGMACELRKHDFENGGAFSAGLRWSLISAVHTFEHLYNPVQALLFMRESIADDGVVYLRMPDHGVPGFERDLAPGHYSIHPFYHCLDSLLQCLVELGDGFEVAWTSPVIPGQRDTILRPIKKRPTLGLAMIVKNEARDLPRCLDSIVPIIDAAVVMDTGSTDDTKKIAAYHTAAVPSVAIDDYFGASEQDANGNWSLWDFSKARNAALEQVEAFRPDWVTWMDGDDELLDPAVYQRSMYRGDVDTFAAKVDSEGQVWLHQRLWRASAKVRFKGLCHEYPVIDGLRSDMMLATVRHHNEPHASQENANARNLRMLMREWDASPSERGAFYIANTHKDGGRHAQAIEWYLKRLAYGPESFRDEWLFAWLYMCRALRGIGRGDVADAELAAAEIVAPNWCEFTIERAGLAYDAKDYKRAIEFAAKCIDQPITPTPLWREPHCYRDGPCRLISWCYDHQGEVEKAALWAIHAHERIGKPDADHEARTRHLKAHSLSVVAPRPAVEAPAIVKRGPEQIALVRPGAIGDVLMTLNLIPLLKAQNPDVFISYYTDGRIGAPDALGPYMLRAGVNVVMDVGGVDAWKGDRLIRLVGYPLAEGYPNKPMRRHLLQYFAAEMGLPDCAPLTHVRDGERVLGETPLNLPALEMALPKRPARHLSTIGHGEYFTVQRAAGWSKYKEWSEAKWCECIETIVDETGAQWNAIEKQYGYSLYDSVALIANARMHLGIDSFGNHLTNYFWRDGNRARRVPGVILWGSTQMEAAGYPSNVNIGHRLRCGPCFKENPAISRMSQGLCVDPPGQLRHDEGVHACMASITVDEVVAAALKVWEGAK